MIDLWKKLLLIGGCSFSEPKGYIGHGGWIPWTDQFVKNIKILGC